MAQVDDIALVDPQKAMGLQSPLKIFHRSGYVSQISVTPLAARALIEKHTEQRGR